MILIYCGSVAQDDGTYLYYHYDTKKREVVKVTKELDKLPSAHEAVRKLKTGLP